ncbi:MAG: DUF4352 domain-containing protein [Actinomycetota bacterium]
MHARGWLLVPIVLLIAFGCGSPGLRSPARVGQTVEVNDLQATVVRVDGDFQTPEGGGLKNAQLAGKRIVAVDFRLTNAGRSARLVSTDSQFQLKDGANHQFETSPWSPEPKFPEGKLFAGETSRGWVAFLVPSEAAPLRLVFDTSFLGGVPVSFDLGRAGARPAGV